MTHRMDEKQIQEKFAYKVKSIIIEEEKVIKKNREKQRQRGECYSKNVIKKKEERQVVNTKKGIKLS